MVLSAWLRPLSMMLLRFGHVVALIRSSFLFIAKWYSDLDCVSSSGRTPLEGLEPRRGVSGEAHIDFSVNIRVLGPYLEVC